MPQLPRDPIEPFWRPAGRSLRRESGGLVIGEDEATVFVVAEDGSDWSVDPMGVLPRRFVNSSTECLATFLADLPPSWRTLAGVDDDEAEHIVHELGLRLQSIDPPALRNDEAYWAVVVEQIRLGLL
jgi:hypothetical protein